MKFSRKYWDSVRRVQLLCSGGRIEGTLTTLSEKEREVAKLAAFGMSNQQIADSLNISVPIVKQAIRIVSEKSGLPRSDFAAIL